MTSGTRITENCHFAGTANWVNLSLVLVLQRHDVLHGEIRLHAAEAYRAVGQTDTAMTHYAAAAETGTPSDVETARAAMAELTRLAEARP